ncbi:MAG: hypothetical protein EXQ91_01110 [Alphaproteobacteria bacterium]|nr:hypothetical protein [Alphaproteobacteria bacterium]
MPFTLVGVEADRHMFAAMKAHFTENGLDPADHWLLNVAVSSSNAPVPFTVSPVRTGTNFAMHHADLCSMVVDAIVKHDRAAQAVRNLVFDGTTGVSFQFGEVPADIEMVSTMTVADVVSPLGPVDYLEIDMQSSELTALPPAIDLLSRRVRRIHLGTHSPSIHAAMRSLFEREWEVEIDLAPATTYLTRRGSFTSSDGVLGLVNRCLAR